VKIEMVRGRRGTWQYRVVCDVCGGEIENILLGMVIWLDPAGWGDGNPGDAVEPYVVHKGACDQELNQKFGKDAHLPWHELSWLFSRIHERMILQHVKARKARVGG
jgi:hypothetical protein